MENAVPATDHPLEFFVRAAVNWLRLGVETTGATIIGLGALVALGQFVRAALTRQPANFNAIRLLLSRYLALALEFQLGADILSTAIAPSWQEIGKLGAIAFIRTGLNYFLSREMREENQTVGGERTTVVDAAPEVANAAAASPSMRRPERA